MPTGISLRSATYRPQMLLITPEKVEMVDRPSSSVIRPAPSLPDGVSFETEKVDIASPASTSTPAPPIPKRADLAAKAAFTSAEVDRLTQGAGGEAQLSTLDTASGVHGQVLETSHGASYRMFLPAGVLPQPLLLEKTTDSSGKATLAASSAENSLQKYPARLEGNGKVLIGLTTDGPQGVFDENTLGVGMITPRFQAYDRTRQEDPGYVTPDDYKVTVGARGDKQNLEERVEADGTRVVVADHLWHTDFKSNGSEEKETFVELRQEPGHEPSAFYVTRARDNSWFIDGGGWDYRGETRQPLDVQASADRAFELVPTHGPRAWYYAVKNKLKNFYKGMFYQDMLGPYPHDLTVVRPFSASVTPQDAPANFDLLKARDGLLHRTSVVHSDGKKLFIGNVALDIRQDELVQGP